MLMFWATLESETGSVQTLQLLENGAGKLPKIQNININKNNNNNTTIK